MIQDSRLKLALVLNLAIVAVQIGFGIAAHSLALAADGAHNLTDAAAVGLALLALQLTRRPATARRSFGYHRSTILAAQANAAGLLVITALLTYEGVHRLLHPVRVHGATVIVVAAIALVANGVAAFALDDRSGDLNMRAALLHMAGDAFASAGVVVAGVVIVATGGNYWLDPAMSLVIGAVILYRAAMLLGHTTNVLLEASPAGLDLDSLATTVLAVDGVDDVHDLHAWSLSSNLRALSAHLVMTGHPTLEEAQLVGDRVKALLGRDFEIAHATLELECEPCLEPHIDPCAVSDVGVGAGHAGRSGHDHRH